MQAPETKFFGNAPIRYVLFDECEMLRASDLYQAANGEAFTGEDCYVDTRRALDIAGSNTDLIMWLSENFIARVPSRVPELVIPIT